MLGELIEMLSDEELIRLRRRSEMRGNHWMAKILTDELEERSLGRHEAV